MRLRIVDLDGAVTEQHLRLGHGVASPGDIVPARDLAPRLRIVAAQNALRALGQRIGQRAAGETEVFLYGSGDFHHITDLLLARIEEPVTVIHFDNHPDWVTFPATSNCGSWVCRALERPNVRRVVTIGPTSADLAFPELKAANLRALRDGRLEIYPWRAAPTRLWGRPVNNASATTSHGRLIWRNLAEEAWDEFVEDLLDRLGPEPVWITFDKDVLSSDEAVTNWDQGAMRLDQVLFAVERIAARRRILGVDICGDFSPPRFRDPMRYVLASFDHPRQPEGHAATTEINASTNTRIIAELQRVLS